MKKLIGLLTALVICFSFGMTTFASPNSPGATEPTETTQSRTPAKPRPSTPGNPMTGPGTSPKTNDLPVVPVLVAIAIGGTTLAVVSKKKLSEEK